MNARFSILRYGVILLLCFSGCGTRSIVVPVTRPALIDLHSCSRIVIPPVQFPLNDDAFTAQVGKRLDEVLFRTLAAHEGPAFLKLPQKSSSRLITERGTVSLAIANDLAKMGQARCVLYCAVIDAAYHEGRLQAEIKDSRESGKIKHVRQGRSSATCHLLVIDVLRETVTFADTIRVSAEHETHAVNQEPAELQREKFVDDMVRRIAEDIAAASRPFEDRDVVTFLVDDAFPEIDAAIVLAELGKWQEAARLLYDCTIQANVPENADILWYDLGLVLQYQQDFKGALDAFEQAIAIRDRSRYRRAIEVLLQAEGQFLQSIRRDR